MSENILEKIIIKKKEKINELKKNITIRNLEDKIEQNKTFINFKDSYENVRKFILSRKTYEYLKSLQNV